MPPESAKMTHVCDPPAATADTETVLDVDTLTWARFVIEAAVLPVRVPIVHDRARE